LFGVVAHCVYLIGYSLAGDKRELKLWIPRRSKTKQTYAGMLDVTVAGAMVVGDEDAWNCVSREAFEEASLSVELVGAQAKEVARVSYFGVSTGNPEHGGGEAGLCLPEFGVVFEMKLDEGVVLKPRDGEVEKFYCWGVQEVKEALERGEFKGNSGAVMMDWLQRSGMLGQEKDIGAQVIRRMRRVLEFPHM
jgi:8-oxo-dGTP pyrophosphatase MutT (NUDIX family)